MADKPTSEDSVEKKTIEVEVKGEDNLLNLNENLSKTNSKVQDVKNSFNEFASTTLQNSAVYKQYSSYLNSISSELSLISKITSEGTAFSHKQADAIAMVSSRLVDANKLFSDFGSGINFNNLNSFTEQFQDFQSIVDSILESSKGLGLDKVAEKIQSTTGMSIPIDILKQGTSVIVDFMKRNAASADASLRLRDAILQTAAATGQLDKVYTSSGENLEKINALTAQHAETISKATIATNMSHKDVVAYYGALAKVPGMIEQVIRTADRNSEQLSALTATIQLSRGANKDYSNVIQDVNTAYMNYNATLEEALNFSGRMTEVSSRLGIELQFVENFVEGASKELGRFGNNTDASAKVLLNYGKGLREVGASGAQAVDIVKEMESNITRLSMAQKAFISAQSGGPGGMMGAFRIEKLLKEGKSDEVFEMIRKQLTKQFGKIVTLEDATQTPQMAAQYQRQRQLLMQGPLGKIVSNEGDANRVMEMFKNMQTGAFKREDLKEKSYEDYMKKGRMLSEQTQTPFGMMSNMVTDAATKATNSKLNFMQETFAARLGRMRPNPEEETDTNVKIREGMLNKMSDARVQNVEATTSLKEDLKEGSARDRTGEYLGRSLKQASEFTTKVMPKAMIDAPLERVKNFISPMSRQTPEKEEEKLKIINEEIKKPKESKDNIKAIESRKEPVTRQILSMKKDVSEDKKQTKEDQKEIKLPTQETKVDVRVTGICIDCGKKMNEHSALYATNPGTNK